MSFHDEESNLIFILVFFSWQYIWKRGNAVLSRAPGVPQQILVDLVYIGSRVQAGGRELPGHGRRLRVSSRVPPATAPTDPLHSHHLHKDDIEVFILFPNTKDLIRNSTARWSWGRTEKEKKKRIHSFELVKIRTHFNEE